MIFRLALTPGEPAGIGPDLCVQHAFSRVRSRHQLVVVADPDLLLARADQLGAPLTLNHFDPDAPPRQTPKGSLDIVPVSLAETCRPGILNPANAPYVLETLNQAVDGCLAGHFDALITGPVQKSIINDAGIPFTGHTEYLAERCAAKQVVMMLATTGLRVALATTHLPLQAVPAAITRELLQNVLAILHRDLEEKFGLQNPRILVAGLNPHAGENGHIGREEIDVINPVIEACRRQGMNLQGPLPADTLFTEKVSRDADAVLTMYHDQGLPVLKYRGFGHAVNITLGLPMIRTSVDHGTALPLAGSGKADMTSLKAAIDSAADMAKHWRNRR